MNLLTLPLVNPRHYIGKLEVLAYLLFEALMRAYFDAYMKLLYPLCLVRWVCDESIFELRYLKNALTDYWSPYLMLNNNIHATHPIELDAFNIIPP